MTLPDIVAELTPTCRDERRRADVLAHPFLNGIDWVEYERRPAAPNPCVLVVQMLRDMPAAAYGLLTQPELAVIAGGTRVRAVRALAIRRPSPAVLEIDVSEEGDFSTYWLALGWRRGSDGRWEHVLPEVDRPFSIAPINFKAGCPADFDCAPEASCPPEPLVEPALDYRAKDYASFRQLLLDLVAQRNPRWTERSPADLGITMLELLAYVGDQISYFQDAAANEAYLETARQRVSAKRHARLVDYRMHDGRNAWTWAHVAVSAAGTLPMHTQLVTRVAAPLAGRPTPPGVTIPEAQLAGDAFETDPALAGARVFETAFALPADPASNELRLHTWGNRECCMGRGSTSAYVYALTPPGALVQVASRPPLAAGDYLLLEEVLGPVTGAPADADPAHRAVVLLEHVEPAPGGADLVDPAYRDTLLGGELQPFTLGDTPLPLLKVTWRSADALTFPLCLTARTPAGAFLRDVSVARGNMVLVDDGRTVEEVHDLPAPLAGGARYRLTLRRGPLTMQCQPAAVDYDDATGRLTTERRALDCAVAEARPAVALRVEFATPTPELWAPVPDLLDSPPNDPAFVADVGNDGRATLRFGDGEHGREPAGATRFTATYRIGNGTAGLIGIDALAHVVVPLAPVGWPTVDAVTNPLPGTGGAAPETIEEVRQYAPAAFRAEQFRAVTEADYAAAALKAPGVAGAVAQFRWTGSWHTVFLGIDPARMEDLVTEPGGRTLLAPAFERTVRTVLGRYRLAGYDLELRTARYVPLEVDVELCVCREHFRADVAEAVRRALSGRLAPDGSRGFFDPAGLTFGQPVYLSQLYAVIESVEGVQSAVVTRFERWDREPEGELEAGVLPIGLWEIARLDNDPSAPENGVLRITALGGK